MSKVGWFVVALILFLMWGALCCQLHASTNFKQTYILSDHQFTNTEMFTLKQYESVFGSWFKNKNDVRYIVEIYQGWGINPLLAFVTIHKEGLKRDSYMFGCGIHLDKAKHMTNRKNFYSQVCQSAWTFKYWFTNASKEKYQCFIFDTEKYERVDNRATFSLYKYTPHANHICYGARHGNYVIPGIWNYYYRMLKEAPSGETNKIAEGN